MYLFIKKTSTCLSPKIIVDTDWYQEWNVKLSLIKISYHKHVTLLFDANAPVRFRAQQRAKYSSLQLTVFSISYQTDLRITNHGGQKFPLSVLSFHWKLESIENQTRLKLFLPEFNFNYNIYIKILHGCEGIDFIFEWEILSAREDKIRIPARPCNVMFILLILIKFPHKTKLFYSFSKQPK